MKKTLIALAVAGLPAVSMADVTIYGTLKGGIENVDNGNINKTNVDDLGSRLGFKGTEDLGNGLKAIWQVETGFALDGTGKDGTSSSGTFANRESFVGLGSAYGSLRMGNLSNFQDSDMAQVDYWEYNSNALGLGVFTRDDTRIKNAVRIDTANFGGFKGAFLYGTKEDLSNQSKDRETYNLGLSYENSGFFGKYAYTHETALSNGPSNDKHRLEAGYNANNLYVALGYQQNKGDYSVTALPMLSNIDTDPNSAASNDKYKSKEYALTAGYSFGALTPKITYAQGDDVERNGNSIDGTGYKQWILGVDYALSKRTTLGAQYGELKYDGYNLANPDENKIKAFGVNMIHSF
ncbi:porin [uncultured Aquitalea sp.]|uniref:porin n=1 Tax=uncultured Aquitalea sp. TaxID=540272 RepID=UPI0025F178EF|nr:porin [uncultured Aquitalea sp.]